MVTQNREMILVDDRWIGPHGIGRFAHELRKRLPALRPLPAFWPLLHPLEPVLLTGVLCALRPQVYFSPGFNPPLWNPGPFVFTLHDLIHVHMPAEASRAKHAYYRLVVRPAAHRAYRVLTVSHYTHQEIVAWTGLPAERVVMVQWCWASVHPWGDLRQLLENLRRKSLLPRLRNDRVISLLSRLFRLAFGGFCSHTRGYPYLFYVGNRKPHKNLIRLL